jgi:hypothetical protein
METVLRTGRAKLPLSTIFARPPAGEESEAATQAPHILQTQCSAMTRRANKRRL